MQNVQKEILHKKKKSFNSVLFFIIAVKNLKPHRLTGRIMRNSVYETFLAARFLSLNRLLLE